MKATENMIGKYVIVRAEGAGVFAGILKEKDGNEVVLTDARRLWYWAGAASLSQLAQEGTHRPQDCKFPCAVDEIVILNVLEIIGTTEAAEKSIREVRTWTA